MPARKRQLERRDYQKLQALAAKGRTRKGIAAELRMVFSDFSAELKKNPMATLRLEKGEADHEQQLLDRLHRQADATNPSAITPTLFLLKSRHKWNDRPPPEPAQHHTHVNVYVPQALTAEQYMKRVSAHVPRAQLTDGAAADE